MYCILYMCVQGKYTNALPCLASRVRHRYKTVYHLYIYIYLFIQDLCRPLLLNHGSGCMKEKSKLPQKHGQAPSLALGHASLTLGPFLFGYGFQKTHPMFPVLIILCPV